MGGINADEKCASTTLDGAEWSVGWIGSPRRQCSTRTIRNQLFIWIIALYNKLLISCTSRIVFYKWQMCGCTCMHVPVCMHMYAWTHLVVKIVSIPFNHMEYYIIHFSCHCHSNVDWHYCYGLFFEMTNLFYISRLQLAFLIHEQFFSFQFFAKTSFINFRCTHSVFPATEISDVGCISFFVKLWYVLLLLSSKRYIFKITHALL